jgi:hypothetical protein
MEAARVVFHVTQGVRISWAHGLLGDDACLDSIVRGVDLIFGGLAAPDSAASAGLGRATVAGDVSAAAPASPRSSSDD